MAGEGVAAPVFGDHPFLLEAWRESGTIATWWRELWKVPLGDPRLERVTEEDMLRDVLVHVYHAHRVRQAVDPGSAAREALKASPAAQQRFVADGQAFLDDPETMAKLRKVTAPPDSGPSAPPSLRMKVKHG